MKNIRIVSFLLMIAEVALQIITKVEGLQYTIALCALCIIIPPLVSRLNSDKAETKKIAVSQVSFVLLVILSFWLIVIVVKAIRLPEIYEDLILYPLLLATVAYSIIKGTNIWKYRKNENKDDR